MNKHLDRLLKAFKPGPGPHTLVKEMVAEQGHWNDLFSTKLIEALERVDALSEKERKLRLECTERIAAVEELARRLNRELTEKVATLEEVRTPSSRQLWIWACSLAALLSGVSALAISLRGLR